MVFSQSYRECTHVDREYDVKRGVRSKIPGQIIFEDGWMERGAREGRWTLNSEWPAAAGAEGKLGRISQAQEFLAARIELLFSKLEQQLNAT